MTKRATWKEHKKHGDLKAKGELPDSAFSFPDKRKEPLTDASRGRHAIARFDQVVGVTDAEREQVFANLKQAAGHYGVEVTATTWKEFGKPHRKDYERAGRERAGVAVVALRLAQ